MGSARREKTDPRLEDLHRAVAEELQGVLQQKGVFHDISLETPPVSLTAPPRVAPRPPSSLGRGGGRGSRRFTPRTSAPPPPIPEEEEVISRGGDGRISLKLDQQVENSHIHLLYVTCHLPLSTYRMLLLNSKLPLLTYHPKLLSSNLKHMTYHLPSAT